MSIRRTNIDRLTDARKSSVPSVGKGVPSNSQGVNGDITVRRLKDSFKFFIKANGIWHGVPIGRGFDKLESTLKKIEEDYVKDFDIPVDINLRKIFSEGNFTLDSSGNISLDTSSTNKEIIFKSSGTEFGRVEAHHAASYFRLLENMGASADDYFEIKCEAAGVTTIATKDGSPSSGANLTIDVEGNIKINSSTGLIQFEDGVLVMSDFYNNALTNNQFRLYTPGVTTDFFKIAVGLNGGTTISTTDSDGAVGHLKFEPNGSFLIKEAADAGGDVAGYGQIWVKDEAPCELYFTTDAGDDIQLTDGTSAAGGSSNYTYETKVCNFYTNSVNNQWIPLVGYIIERDTIAGWGEYVSLVAPFNGTLERIMFRSEAAHNGTLEFDLYESSDGTEVPGTEIGTKDTSINIADDTTVTVDFDSMTSGTNALVKGRIYAIQIDTPSIPYDTCVTAVFKWDITS